MKIRSGQYHIVARERGPSLAPEAALEVRHIKSFPEHLQAISLEQRRIPAHVGSVLPIRHQWDIQIQEFGNGGHPHPQIPVGALAQGGIEISGSLKQRALTDD